MPIYNSPTFSHDINRQAVMLDTNILVAAFRRHDDFHEVAIYFLNEWPDPFIIPISVLVECWGMLEGSYKNRQAAIDLYKWASSPGNATIFPQESATFNLSLDIINEVRVDSVDALIAQLAHDISIQCQLNPPLKIVTLDTKDIIKCRVQFNLNIGIFDLRSYDEY